LLGISRTVDTNVRVILNDAMFQQIERFVYFGSEINSERMNRGISREM
jgi:hypothetical protein